MEPVTQVQQLASARAHEILAEMVQGNKEAPKIAAVGVAEDKEHRIKVVVHIVEFAPMKIDLVQNVRANVQNVDPDTEIVPSTSIPFLSGLQMRVLNVLRFDQGMVGGKISTLLKVSYGGEFRQALANLRKMGFADNHDDGQGYWATKAGKEAHAAQLERLRRERSERSNRKGKGEQ